jgi:hypothetical protein
MSDDTTYSAIRRALLVELRRLSEIQERNPFPMNNQPLLTYNLARQLAQHHTAWPTDDIWRAI